MLSRKTRAHFSLTAVLAFALLGTTVAPASAASTVTCNGNWTANGAITHSACVRVASDHIPGDEHAYGYVQLRNSASSSRTVRYTISDRTFGHFGWSSWRVKLSQSMTVPAGGAIYTSGQRWYTEIDCVPGVSFSNTIQVRVQLTYGTTQPTTTNTVTYGCPSA